MTAAAPVEAWMLWLLMLVSLLRVAGRRLASSSLAGRLPDCCLRQATRLGGTQAGSAAGGDVFSENPRTPLRRKGKKLVLDNSLRDALIECVRSKDYDQAMEIHRKLRANNTVTVSVLYSLLSTCYRADHLDSASSFFREILNQGVSPSEQAYLALIRCYADADQFDHALSLIESMQELNIEIRHRTFQPILDTYLRNRDLKSILNLLMKMLAMGIHPRSEQISILLKCCSLVDGTPFEEAIDALLFENSKDLVGLDYATIKDLKAVYENISPEQVVDEGILVNSLESLPGKVIEQNDSFVITQNATFDIVESLESLEDTRVGNTTRDFSNENDPNVERRTSAVGTVDTDFTRPDLPTYVEDKYILRDSSFETKRASIVEINSDSCTCPNCGAKIRNIPLTEDVKESARVGLIRVASAATVAHCKNLQNFGTWLEERAEFKYVIDGANVAYNRQNFGHGKFSYRQVFFVLCCLPNDESRLNSWWMPSRKIITTECLYFSHKLTFKESFRTVRKTE